MTLSEGNWLCHGLSDQLPAHHCKGQVQPLVSPCQIFGGQTDSGMDFSPCCCVLPCQHNSTNVLYSFIMYP